MHVLGQVLLHPRWILPGSAQTERQRMALDAQAA